jgi:hypothetical protein
VEANLDTEPVKRTEPHEAEAARTYSHAGLAPLRDGIGVEQLEPPKLVSNRLNVGWVSAGHGLTCQSSFG